MPHEFEAQDGDVRSTGFPGLVRVNGTTIPVSGYAFDAAVIEEVFFRFRASDYTAGSTVPVDLDWYAGAATSGNVVWAVQLAAITPSVDTQDVETDGLSTAVQATAAAGASAHRLIRTRLTLPNGVDSLAPDDQVVLRVARLGSNGSDTMAGDAVLTYVTVAA